MNITTAKFGVMLTIIMLSACAMSGNTAGVIAGIFFFLLLLNLTEDAK